MRQLPTIVPGREARHAGCQAPSLTRTHVSHAHVCSPNASPPPPPPPQYPTESIMHVFTRGHPNLLPIEGSDDGTKWHKIVGHLQAFMESSDVVEITAALDTIKEYKETSDDLSDLQLTLLKSLNTIFDAYVEKDAAEEDAGKEKEAGEEKEAEEKADL